MKNPFDNEKIRQEALILEEIDGYGNKEGSHEPSEFALLPSSKLSQVLEAGLMATLGQIQDVVGFFQGHRHRF